MSEPSQSKGQRTAGLVVSGLVAFAMIASGIGKQLGPEVMKANFEKYHLTGYLGPIGVLEIVIGILFAVRKTSSIGTLLATGYFGGAIVAHLASGAPAEMVPAVVLGALAWVGGGLRNPSLFASLRS